MCPSEGGKRQLKEDNAEQEALHLIMLDLNSSDAEDFYI